MPVRSGMKKLKHILTRIREGRLKQLISEMLWMYIYVRRFWLMIVIYVLLGASGSILGLGTSMVSRDLVDAVTISFRVRQKVTNEIRADIYEQVLHTDWEALAGYRSGDLLYRVNGDAGSVANSVLTFLPNAVTALVSFGGAFIVMIRNDPAMAVIALAGAPVSFFTSRYTTRKMRQFQRENQELSSDRTVQ